MTRLQEIVSKQRSRLPLKGVLIGNANRKSPPTDRTDWFDSESMEVARQFDLCLLPTDELCAIVYYLLKQAESGNVDDVKASIRREIITCDSQLELNREKYRLQ